MLEWNSGEVGQFRFQYSPAPGRFRIPPRSVPPAVFPPSYGHPRLTADPSSLTVAQKLELAAQWDARDPSWLRISFQSFGGGSGGWGPPVTWAWVPIVHCPSGTPQAGTWITTRVTEADYIQSQAKKSYDDARRIWLVWAVDQVLIHGCSGAQRVDTPCPAGSTRVLTRQSPQGSCLTCSPPLRIFYDRDGYADCRRAPALTEVPRPGSLRIPSRRLSGFDWNNGHGSQLGAPVQLVSGNRYMSRWLGVLSPAVDCGPVLSSVRQAIQQASAQPTWPWSNLVASSSPPSGFPPGVGYFPFTAPGYCPIWMDGTWTGATTPVMDSRDIPAIPGLFNTDLFNYTTQKSLVEVPKAPNLPTGSPCDPAELTFDPVSGIFKCAGVVMTSPGIPSPQTPNPCPGGQARRADGTCPPAEGGGSGTKTEEKSVWPWVVGGAVVLVGGGYLLTR